MSSTSTMSDRSTPSHAMHGASLPSQAMQRVQLPSQAVNGQASYLTRIDSWRTALTVIRHTTIPQSASRQYVCVNAVEAINMMVMSINVLVVVPLTIHCADRRLAIEIVQTDSSTGKLVSGQARQLSSSSASALAKLPQSNGRWLAD